MYKMKDAMPFIKTPALAVALLLADQPAFSVQYSPEASPEPEGSRYLFERFVGMMG